MLTVRLASLDDLESIVALYTRAWRAGFGHMFSAATFARDDFDLARRDECRESVLHDGVDTYVVEHLDRVAGFIAASVDGGTTVIDDLWLHPHEWGCGGAAALVARIEDDVRARGGRRLTTWVPEDSPTGRRFFEKVGWRPTGAIEWLSIYPDDANRVFEYERTLA